MVTRKLALMVIAFCLTSLTAFAQIEAEKDVINALANFRAKNDVKLLGDAKKAVDATFKIHADSVDYGKNVFKAVVYANIVYSDSLNTLKLPDTLLAQTTKLVNRLLKNRKGYRFANELNFARGCLANVYQRIAFSYYYKNNYRVAIVNFNTAKKYVPAAKEVDVYLADIYYKLGNYKTALVYYDTILNYNRPKVEHFQTASNIYKILGDTTRSLQIIQQGLSVHPNDRYLITEEANIYNNRKNYALLKPLLNDLILLTPDDPSVLFMAANCYDHLNDWNQAELFYQKAIEVNNADYDPIFNLGLLYLKKATSGKQANEYMANINQSKNLLEKAEDMVPNNQVCLKALQLLYLQTDNQSGLVRVNNKLSQLTN